MFPKPVRRPRQTVAERLAQQRRNQRRSQARAAIPQLVRDFVRERSKGRCEIQGPGCTGRAEHLHHLTHRGIGGRSGVAKAISDSPDNLIASCPTCHMTQGHNLRVAE